MEWRGQPSPTSQSVLTSSTVVYLNKSALPDIAEAFALQSSGHEMAQRVWIPVVGIGRVLDQLRQQGVVCIRALFGEAKERQGNWIGQPVAEGPAAVIIVITAVVVGVHVDVGVGETVRRVVVFVWTLARTTAAATKKRTSRRKPFFVVVVIIKVVRVPEATTGHVEHTRDGKDAACSVPFVERRVHQSRLKHQRQDRDEFGVGGKLGRRLLEQTVQGLVLIFRDERSKVDRFTDESSGRVV